MQRSAFHKRAASASAPRHAPARVLRQTLVAGVKSSSPQPQAASGPLQDDPEAQFRRYGAAFGGRYQLNEPQKWLADAPRVRVRTLEDRKLEELLELVVLNERLAGMPAWETRRRLEYLKLRRRNWEAIYHYITETDAVATLELVEEANRRVEEALIDEEASGRTGVAALQEKLLSLQQEVDAARNKLERTQARVEQNLQRVNELKAQAATLERLRTASTVTLPEQGQQAAAGSTAAAAASSKAAYRSKRSRGLHSSLEIEEPLRNFWYPAEFSKTLGKDMMVPLQLFGEDWVLFRDEKGQPSCIRDTCAHRACPLSLGKVVGGQVECAYHGWQFNSDGACTKMPSTPFCRNVAVAALPCAEKDGFIWVWPGGGAPPEVPGFTAPPPGFDVHAEIVVEVPVEHGLLVENLLDLAHAPFTHTSTFARGWPIPDVVRFHANKMLAGHWDPYPINMSFQPPCCTVSCIGMARPGKVEKGLRAEQCQNHLHQLHVCMPSRKGHTRLLYRMSMDFMGWLRYVPFIDKVWKQVAAQVLGEDLVLVTGQQDRMLKGDDTWANPMAYDKLAVRYRRWRNAVAEGDTAESSRLLAQSAMSAGEVFAPVDEEEEHSSSSSSNNSLGSGLRREAGVFMGGMAEEARILNMTD